MAENGTAFATRRLTFGDFRERWFCVGVYSASITAALPIYNHSKFISFSLFYLMLFVSFMHLFIFLTAFSESARFAPGLKCSLVPLKTG